MAKQRLPEVLEEDELERFLAAAAASGPRDGALTMVMAYGGLRVAEACRLRWEDVPERAQSRAALHVRQGKGGKDRMVPVHPRLAASLEAWRSFDVAQDGAAGTASPLRKTGLLRSPDEGGWVFPGRRRGKQLTTRQAEYIVEQLGRAAGLARSKAHPHALRHTVATRLLRATGNLELVKTFLGHASVATTQIYTHLVVDDVAAGLDKLT